MRGFRPAEFEHQDAPLDAVDGQGFPLFLMRKVNVAPDATPLPPVSAVTLAPRAPEPVPPVRKVRAKRGK